MVEKLFQDILSGIDVRQNLSSLRQEIKSEYEKEKVEDLIDIDNYRKIVSLLDSEDPKTRKNCALFMGDMELDALFLQPLFDAYQKEDTLFVKSSYLTAMSCMDYEQFLPELKERLKVLGREELLPENKKHILEEMRILSDMVVRVEGTKKHRFTGEKREQEFIMLLNRNHIDTVMKQLEEVENLDMSKVKPFAAGITLKTDCLHEILPMRTWHEILFLIDGMKTCEMDALQAAKDVADSKLLSFLKGNHNGTFPFYFRVEIKSKNMPLDKKSIFAKKLCGEIERLTKRQMINNTSSYEVELRLVETKEKKFNILVRLNTIEDQRFAYRKEVIAASIKPVNAALLVQLAKPYMIPDARVLDPFCGVGTMLIERQKVVKANTSYGIDMYNDAIQKAHINTEAARQIIHYVNKDFFEFTHEYLFDEIFTNMPFPTGHKSEEEIYAIYERFFGCIRTHLEKDGTIILYTHNKDYVKRLVREKNFVILKEFEINTKEYTHLFIIK